MHKCVLLRMKSTIQKFQHTNVAHRVWRQGYSGLWTPRSTETDSEDPACSYSEEISPTHVKAHTKQQQQTSVSEESKLFAVESHNTSENFGNLAGSEKRFVCGFCRKSFTCPKYLQSHQRVHTGEKPFSCSQCGKRFGQAVYLKKHQNVHTGEKPFVCPLCGKQFADASNLIRHKSVHTGERPFI
uniref:C2H2-type domain-containing protein n=1 Tax=Oncorhynchus tshawytscha TaxID=74940 RepID=A0AAZ3QZM4_ONCTS